MTKRKNRGGRKKGSLSNVVFRFKGLDKKEYSLTSKQKKFAEHFVGFDGNGVDAVIEAGYDCYYPRSKSVNRKAAAVLASENLRKPNICAYIAKIFEDVGLNDEIVDKHHLFNIVQMDDLGAKNKAIDMYNKKKGRYAPEEHEHTIKTVKVIDYGNVKLNDNSSS